MVILHCQSRLHNDVIMQPILSEHTINANILYEMKRIFFTFAMAVALTMALSAKTLVVYYSFTNNVHAIVSSLRSQIQVDIVRVEPAEKGLDYAANNYAIGSRQISAIRANPDDEASYPAIDPVEIEWDEYETVIVATPLWWSSMAAPMQTFLFTNRSAMAGKNIGLIVSSASSGISGVESDAKRLVPEGHFLAPSLWVRSSQTSSAATLITDWLEKIDYKNLTNDEMDNKISITANGHTLSATLVDNSSARALRDMLVSGPVTIHMADYGNMEKVGPLPQYLPVNDEPINTEPGDIILYEGHNLVIYYDTNSWNFTRLGKVDNVHSGQWLKQMLGDGEVDVTLSLVKSGAIDHIYQDAAANEGVYDMKGMRVATPDDDVDRLPGGIYIINGKKILK